MRHISGKLLAVAAVMAMAAMAATVAPGGAAVSDVIPKPTVSLLDPRPSYPGTCRQAWHPSILTPVLSSYRELTPAQGTPMNVFVAFPTLGESIDAGPLTGCGRYPLVLLLNGQCQEEPDHYRRWGSMAMALARAGYVVVVPHIQHAVPPWDNPDETAALHHLLAWMRGSWEHSSILLPRPATAVIGHSYGALMAGQLAATQAHPFSAYVSLSGVWSEYPNGPDPLFRLNIPSLFTWGEGLADFSANIDRVWEQLATVKHKVRFPDGGHFDYLRAGPGQCRGQDGVNPAFMRWLSIDLVMAFLSHYLPPEYGSALAQQIPHSLQVPLPLQLTPSQQPYAIGHLNGFARLDPNGQTTAVHTYALWNDNGEVTFTGD